MIPDPLEVGILAFAGLIVAALIAAATTLAVQMMKWQIQNQRLWAWNRALQDHIYRGSPPPPPEAPDGLFD